jgi:hypothetical protein
MARRDLQNRIHSKIFEKKDALENKKNFFRHVCKYGTEKSQIRLSWANYTVLDAYGTYEVQFG